MPGEKRRQLACGMRIEGVHNSQHIFVEEADAATNRGFALATWVPRKAQLWREVRIRFPNPVAKARNQRVEFRNRAELAVTATRLARVA